MDSYAQKSPRFVGAFPFLSPSFRPRSATDWSGTPHHKQGAKPGPRGTNVASVTRTLDPSGDVKIYEESPSPCFRACM